MDINNEQPKEVGERPDPNIPDETPEKNETGKEGTGYEHPTEVTPPPASSDASYNEHANVTPPKPREFPSGGSAKTDAASATPG